MLLIHFTKKLDCQKIIIFCEFSKRGIYFTKSKHNSIREDFCWKIRFLFCCCSVLKNLLSREKKAT